MPNPGKRIIELRHPTWTKTHDSMVNWRLAYEGGEAFVNKNLRRYSRRETPTEFTERKTISYNPSHTKRVVNSIRNSIAAKLNEVVRTGDPAYQKIIQEDIDNKKSSIDSFLASQVLPMLLVQKRALICVDAPPLPEKTTKAEDDGHPYAWFVSAEDLLTFHEDDDDGILDVALIRESIDETDDETGLTTKCRMRYRFIKYLKPGMEFGGFSGEGVLIALYKDNGEEDGEPVFIKGMTRLPLIDINITTSIVEDIVRHQISLLNLASTDMQFLYRANFPVFTRQIKPNKSLAPKMGTKKVASAPATVSQSSEFDEDDSNNKGATQMGVSTGLQYEEGLNSPSFIAPTTENIKISLEKQRALVEEIQVLSDLSLTNLSIKALEQSGKSKSMDQIGKEAGLAYLGTVLETAERELAEVFHEFLSSAVEYTITYPTDYSLKTQQERNEECESLDKVKKLIRNKMYQKSVEKRIAEIATRPFESAEEVKKIQDSIDLESWLDDNNERAIAIQQDVMNKIMSVPTAQAMRGLDPEVEKAALEAAASAEADLLSGGIVDPVTGEMVDPITGEPMKDKIDPLTGESPFGKKKPFVPFGKK